MFGAIEAGGTKFVCAVGDEKFNIHDKISFPTTTPSNTLSTVIKFFNKYKLNLKGIGIGSFGPIDIHPKSTTYGHIISTPKLHWQNYDFVGALKYVFNIPIIWTTDVNAACYGEYILGHGKNLSNVVYYTFGTGVGGGAIQNGEFIEGFSHPEMGHMLVIPHPKDNFKGSCPFHDNCLEGMASGTSIEQRTTIPGQDLPSDHPLWDFEADYIAQCVHNTTLMLSPDIIILGGGVLRNPHLIYKVRDSFTKHLNSYVKTPKLESYIVTPKLEGNAGIIGCLALAIQSEISN